MVIERQPKIRAPRRHPREGDILQGVGSLLAPGALRDHSPMFRAVVHASGVAEVPLIRLVMRAEGEEVECAVVSKGVKKIQVMTLDDWRDWATEPMTKILFAAPPTHPRTT